ncbi:MAG: transposase [Rhizobacter sp.]|nr:transposase [Rhizobacter sp.]
MTQRVQHGQPVFAESANRGAYLACLGEAAVRHGVALHAYGIAPTEVRLLATPPDDRAIGRMVQYVGRHFGSHFNRQSGRRGSLWEGRFRCTVVEPASYFMPCLRFVERVADPAASDHGASHAVVDPDVLEVPWSSSPHHAGLRRDNLVSEHPQFWSLGNTPFDRDAAYRRLIDSPQAPEEAREIAAASLHGWALGSASFLHALGSKVARPLRPRLPGRPPAAGIQGK